MMVDVGEEKGVIHETEKLMINNIFDFNNKLVSDVITPALLNPALKAAQVEDLAGLKTDGGILYGKFLAAVISFLVIAFVIFLMVKAINSMKKKEEPAPAAPAGPTQEQLLAEIRDLLKK